MRVQFWTDWLQFPFRNFNWINLHFIYIYFEYDKYADDLEFTFALFGFGVTIRQFLGGRTEQYKEVTDRVGSLDDWLQTQEKDVLEK